MAVWRDVRCLTAKRNGHAHLKAQPCTQRTDAPTIWGVWAASSLAQVLVFRHKKAALMVPINQHVTDPNNRESLV
jgi:hypothetical protein